MEDTILWHCKIDMQVMPPNRQLSMQLRACWKICGTRVKEVLFLSVSVPSSRRIMTTWNKMDERLLMQIL